jgi:amidase
MVKGIASVRIGVLREGFGDPVESDVEEAVRESAARLKLLGAQVEDISIPAHLDLDRILLALQVVGTDLSMSTCGGAFLQGYYDTHFIEVFGRFLVNQADLLPPTIKLCMLYGAMQGHRGLKQYGQAQNARIKYRRAYDDIFREVDCLLMPTVPIKAPKYTPPKNDEEALQRTLLRKLARVVTRNSAQFDLTGHPALTVPCALSGNLPVGMQLVGRHFSESLLLQVAFAYEQSFEWNQGVGPADWDPELIVPD